MTKHLTGTREEWLAARLELLEAEKELTRRGDELARRRQELPWVGVDKEYRFQTDEGSASLADLFRGRSQPLREVALPLLREWSKRLSVEGYPTRVEDRLGCRPPTLVFRLAPRGAPESFLTLASETGPSVRFSMNVDGREVGADLKTPLAGLQTRVVLEGLGRFVTAALEATIPRRSDCGP